MPSPARRYQYRYQPLLVLCTSIPGSWPLLLHDAERNTQISASEYFEVAFARLLERLERFRGLERSLTPAEYRELTALLEQLSDLKEMLLRQSERSTR